MKFFSNKHVIVAMIVAPILAVLSYYFVDQVVKEKPRAAIQGNSYPLRADSNCRFTSGACDLVNADFRSRLVVDSENGKSTLKLSSSHSLQDVKVGFRSTASGISSNEVTPVAMVPLGNEQKSWSIEMPMAATVETHLMIAMLANGTHYYAETTMGFSEYKTTFNKNFKSDQ